MDTTPTPEAPVQPLPPQAMASPNPTNSAVSIVWQWLCYSLWEWALISLAILLSSTLTYYFDNSNGTDYTFVLYVLAAMLCLLPLAFVANYFYAKREPEQKHGFAAVVMVINAVGVFLASLGSLITLVVSVLSIFTSATSSTGTEIVITSSIIVVVLGAMLFVRIINPLPLAWFSKLFPYLVILVAGVAVVLSLVGPFKSQVTNRQDRLIEGNLSSVNEDIQTYVTQNDKLPTSLSQIDVSDDDGARQLVKSNLVTYQNLGAVSDTSTNDNSDLQGSTSAVARNASDQLSYKLCVTYKSAKGSPSAATLNDPTNENLALDDISSSHPAGNTCYTLTATDNTFNN